jgi:hypothetical protein
MNFDEQTIAEFEEAGVEDVRLRLQMGLIGSGQISLALQWLREKDAEAARQARACRDQAARAARQEKKMLARSNATIILIATLTLLISIAAWLFPRN